MQKEKNEMVMVAGVLAFLGGISTAIMYFELARQIPMWDWGIYFKVSSWDLFPLGWLLRFLATPGLLAEHSR